MLQMLHLFYETVFFVMKTRTGKQPYQKKTVATRYWLYWKLSKTFLETVVSKKQILNNLNPSILKFTWNPIEEK